MKNPGFLVLSDTYHPDWKAYVDGKKEEIFITDHLIRSVFLKKGVHTVKFKFQPVSFYIGSIISLLSALIFLFLIRKTK